MWYEYNMIYKSLTNTFIKYKTIFKIKENKEFIYEVNINEIDYCNFTLIDNDLYVGTIKVDQMDILTSCGNVIIPLTWDDRDYINSL